MKLKFILLLFLTNATYQLFATAPYMVWDEFSEEDLKMTIYEADSEAVAVVLGEIVDADLQLYERRLAYHYYYHVRIKILKKSGEEYGDLSIPYYKPGFHTYLKDLTAQTVTYEDGKAVRHKIEAKEIFDENYGNSWRIKKLSFRNVKPGAILEYKYTMIEPNLFRIDEHYFQRTDIPVRYSELSIVIPDVHEYEPLLQGIEKADIETRKSLTFTPKGYREIRAMRYIWAVKDLAPLKEEAFISTMSDYLIGIQFRLKFIYSDYGATLKNYSSWASMKREFDQLDDFTDMYQKRSRFGKIAKPNKHILKNKTLSKKQKTEALYNWVANTIEWDGRYNIFAKQTPNQAYLSKSGSSADINIALLALLRAAKIESYGALVSTRSNGKPNEDYPSIFQFNHIIIRVRADGEWIWLDATDPYRPYGLLDDNSLNDKAWVLRGSKGSWEDLEVVTSKKITVLKANLTEEGNLMGELNTTYENYIAIGRRAFLAKSGNEKYEEFRIKDDFGNIEIESFEFENHKKITAPFVEKIKFTLPEYAEGGGGLLYLNPMLKEGYSENIFKLEKRTYPIDLTFPFMEEYTLKLNLPEGYKVEELPQPIEVNLLNGAGSFEFKGEKTADGKVELTTKFELKRTLYQPEEYRRIKSFFDTLVEKHNSMLVLKKEE